LSPIATGATTCNFGSPSCTFATADSGLLFDVPAHVANISQSVNVTAVKKADNSGVCVPAVANASKAVTFKCGYLNPSSGTSPVLVGGVALNAAGNGGGACDASGHPVTLAFDATGVAATTVQYADVGQVQLNAAYAGTGTSESGLSMTGSDTFITAPSTFAFSAITAGPLTAGKPFSATVTARNASGNPTPNFGRETPAAAPTLTFIKLASMGGVSGSFGGSLGSFSGGAATASNLVWSEVGIGDLQADLPAYLTSGLSVTGKTGSAGAVGRFVPDHFDVVVSPACGPFSYSGQPFGVQVTAMNGAATPAVTQNYDVHTGYSKLTTLTDAMSLNVGGFGSTGSVPATAFTLGVASPSPTFTYTTKLTPQITLAVHASDTEVSSTGAAEGSTILRSGRLRLSNAWGSEKTALQVAVQAQYWSGKAWVLNNADTPYNGKACTTVPATAIAKSNAIDSKGAPSSAMNNTFADVTVVNGQANLTVSPASPTATGSIDIALNLGAGAGTPDQSCASGTRPASTGAGVAWLRSQNGGCSTLWDRDPSARVTFGIYSPESTKTVHARELF
jgi:MSHA biogenesis protein MshQ